MLYIKPIQTKEEQKHLCDVCNITYLPTAFAYAAYVEDVFVGMSQFSVSDEYGTIHNLVAAPGTNDMESLFIMGRQTMNWIDLLGIHTCHCTTQTSSEKLLRLMGFRPLSDSPDTLSVDMTHLFDGHCGGNCNLANDLHE